MMKVYYFTKIFLNSVILLKFLNYYINLENKSHFFQSLK